MDIDNGVVHGKAGNEEERSQIDQMKLFDLTELGAPRRARPAAEKVLEGDPQFSTWSVERSEDGRIHSGIWEATPGAWQSAKDGVWEFCTILSGVSELSEDGKPARRVCAGDSFVLRPDFKGVWRVLETTRKAFVTQSPQVPGSGSTAPA